MTLTVEIPMDPCEFCPYGDKEPAEVSNYCSSCDYPEHEVLTVPAKFEVCPTCRGRGKHVNPNIDDRGISAEDFEEDPDFAEDYFKGVYDVRCYECSGNRVVPVIDDAYLNEEEKKKIEAYREYEADTLRYEAEDRATMAREMGWY